MSDETDEHVPNCVVSRQEACGVVARCLRFYPEDVEKLKKLDEVSVVESAYYMLALQGAGRFFHDDENGQKKWRKALSDSGIVLREKKVDGVKWTYTVKDGTASIGDGFGVAIPPSTSGEITIPSTLGGCPVTRIGDHAFSGCRELTGVKIPDSVTSIEDDAFCGCQGLAAVTIPANVTRIGKTAFSCCCGLTSVTIPDGVTYVGGGAFSHCSALASVTIPDSLTKVGGGVFNECRALPKEIIAELEKREKEWFLTSRDKCGRGDDAVPKNEPTDVNGGLDWLQQRRERKEREREELERKRATHSQSWMSSQDERGNAKKWRDAWIAVAVAFVIGVAAFFLYLCFGVR